MLKCVGVFKSVYRESCKDKIRADAGWVVNHVHLLAKDFGVMSKLDANSSVNSW